MRDTCRTVHDTLEPQSTADLATRVDGLSGAYRDRGVTFALSGQERPFPPRPRPLRALRRGAA